jgi:hypothetical protein
MRNTALLIAALAFSVLCWGMYGPIVQWGQAGMSTEVGQFARLRPFVCVGLAYFLIGVIVPGLWLYLRGEKGDWTVSGIVWSLAGGAFGAVGAFGIVMAFYFGGRPVYVMPLVFGGAPVVNAFLTIYLAGRMREIGPLFLAGLIMVVLGAVTVLVFAPHPPASAAAAATAGFFDWIWRLLAILATIVCWGAYGPVLHKGQAAMDHSRMRPFLCVGLAYFALAVVMPNMILAEVPEASTYAHFSGTFWSLMGGAAGACGALGVILAFNFGGRPVYVMPLIFGGAPVINTLFAMIAQRRLGEIGPLFLAGLILVIAGSAIVLVLAPRGPHPAAPVEGYHEAEIHRE